MPASDRTVAAIKAPTKANPATSTSESNFRFATAAQIKNATAKALRNHFRRKPTNRRNRSESCADGLIGNVMGQRTRHLVEGTLDLLVGCHSYSRNSAQLSMVCPCFQLMAPVFLLIIMGLTRDSGIPRRTSMLQFSPSSVTAPVSPHEA